MSSASACTEATAAAVGNTIGAIQFVHFKSKFTRIIVTVRTAVEHHPDDFLVESVVEVLNQIELDRKKERNGWNEEYYSVNLVFLFVQ